METLKINIPEGFEIDQIKSNFIEGNIVFKKQEINYDNIIRKLFLYKKSYYIDNTGTIREDIFNKYSYQDEVNCTSREQAEKLLAINKLMNVAKYLNEGWEPNWNNGNEYKFYIMSFENIIKVDFCFHSNLGNVYFKSRDLAKKAIDIVGMDTIKSIFQTY